MIHLAVDFGKSKIGLAISDETGFVASPLAVIRAKNLKTALSLISDMARKHKSERIVFGIPYMGSSQPSASEEFYKEVAKKLEEVSGIPVVYWDESYSSKFAEKGLTSHQKKHADSLAAASFLQEYLDNQKLN